MSVNLAVEGYLRSDRRIVAGALYLVTLLAWGYLIIFVDQMGLTVTDGMEFKTDSGMKNMGAMMELKPWTALDAVLLFLMWAIMMIGMMTPSAAPMILLYVMVSRKKDNDKNTVIPTAYFYTGYLAVWCIFSVAATTLQWGFERTALLSPMMISVSSILSALILVLAGIYQWTPYKNVCLDRCRNPVWFLSQIWREGSLGAFQMGLIHGTFCLGCCWMLMLLLFVGGVMNLLFVAAITVFVLFEKVSPMGKNAGKWGGAALFLWGMYILYSQFG